MKTALTSTIVALTLLTACDSEPRTQSLKMPEIHAAAGLGNIEAVKLHIANGVDVNAVDDIVLGRTPLHAAAENGRKEVVELLIAAGADVNAKTNSGRGITPLDSTFVFNHTETADLLRKHGGKTGAELKGGEPIAEAAQPEPTPSKASDISGRGYLNWSV